MIDLYPTLNELCGLPPIDSHDGQSLVPLLNDPNATWNMPAIIEFKRGNAAVRTERYRYIRYRDGGEELYDHRTDPNEWTNLAQSENHAIVKGELAGWISKNWADSAPTKSAFRFDPDTFKWVRKETGEITHGKTE